MQDYTYLMASVLNGSSALDGNMSQDAMSIANIKLNVYRYAVPILTLLCIISTAANAYILISVRWLLRSPSPTLAFTLSLCAADTWVSLVMAVGFVFQSYLPYVFGVTLHHQMCFGLAFEAVRMGAMITSILHLLALAVNHYIGITRPLHYSATVTPEVSLMLICVLWILPSMSLIIFFSIIPNQAFLSDQCKQIHFFHGFKFRATIGVFIFVPLFFMIIVYAHIFSVIVKRKTQYANLTHSSIKPVNQNRMHHNMKATVTTTLILGTYVIGWLPCMVQFVLICNDGCLFNTYSILAVHPLIVVIISLINNCLIILKALTDAVIYAYRVRELRMAILNMHNKVCGCHPSSGRMDWNETLRLTSSARNNTLMVKGSQSSCSPNNEKRKSTPECVKRSSRHLSLPIVDLDKSVSSAMPIARSWTARFRRRLLESNNGDSASTKRNNDVTQIILPSTSRSSGKSAKLTLKLFNNNRNDGTTCGNGGNRSFIQRSRSQNNGNISHRQVEKLSEACVVELLPLREPIQDILDHEILLEETPAQSSDLNGNCHS